MPPVSIALAALALAASGGPSFDCAKARGADEWLVCAEPPLAALDRELAGKFQARSRAAPAAAAELRRTQRAWLEERASCTRARGAGAGPTREAAVRCLETSYRWRIDDLDEPPSPERLPDGIVGKRIARRDPLARDLVDVGYPALAPGRPGAAAFDAFFERAARELIDRRSGAEAKGDLDDPHLPETSLTVGFGVPLATARLVTVVMGGQDYGGGAHGMPFVLAVTFDLERGRPLTLDDVFARGPALADELVPIVMERLGPDARDWDGAETNAHGALSRTSSWTFDADGAVVTFPPYAVGPYAIGMPEVRLTWAELRPHLEAGAPLPPR